MDLFLAIQAVAGVALAIIAGFAIERAFWWRRRAETYRRSAELWRARYSCGRSASDLVEAVTVVPRSAGALMRSGDRDGEVWSEAHRFLGSYELGGRCLTCKRPWDLHLLAGGFAPAAGR